MSSDRSMRRDGDEGRWVEGKNIPRGAIAAEVLRPGSVPVAN